MKVTLYVHCFFPNHFYGTEAYTLAVAKGLIARGHEPTVVTAVFDGEPPQAELIERRLWEGIPIISIDKNKVRGSSVRHTFDHPAMAKIHENILLELRPDIVHVCHLINHTAVLLDVLHTLAIPTVATLTDFFGFCFTNKLESANGSLCAGPDAMRANCLSCFLKAAARPAEPLALRLAGSAGARPLVARALAWLAHRLGDGACVLGFRPADIVDRPDRLLRAMSVYRTAIAATDYLRSLYEANGFSPPIVTSRFGVDIDRRPKPPRVPGAPVRFGFIGQIAPHKGVHVLVRALNKVGRTNLSAQIYGDPDQMPDYMRQLKEETSGLPITFPGMFPASQLADVLENIDVLVIPSTWYENSPLILLQALATRTPVIVSDVPGLTEIVSEGTNGLIVARNDIPALATALRRIVDSEALLDRLTKGAQWPRTVSDMVEDVVVAYRGAMLLQTSTTVD